MRKSTLVESIDNVELQSASSRSQRKVPLYDTIFLISVGWCTCITLYDVLLSLLEFLVTGIGSGARNEISSNLYRFHSRRFHFSCAESAVWRCALLSLRHRRSYGVWSGCVLEQRRLCGSCGCNKHPLQSNAAIIQRPVCHCFMREAVVSGIYSSSRECFNACRYRSGVVTPTATNQSNPGRTAGGSWDLRLSACVSRFPTTTRRCSLFRAVRPSNSRSGPRAHCATAQVGANNMWSTQGLA